jgi:hypothetical protein
MKPNNNFELTVRDIEVIESALRAKAGRRGMAIVQGETSPRAKLHHQKVWYRPKKDYVGG